MLRLGLVSRLDLHVVGAQDGAAGDHGRRGLGGHVVAEGGVARLARDADHARKRRCPFVEVGLVLKDAGVVLIGLRRHVLDRQSVVESAEFVAINCQKEGPILGFATSEEMAASRRHVGVLVRIVVGAPNELMTTSPMRLTGW